MLLLWEALLGLRVLSSSSVLYFIPPWTPQMPADVRSYFNFVLTDVPTAYYPWWEYARAALHHGDFPAWNPYALGGTPFYANPQTALFSPFNLPFWTLPFGYAFGVAAAAHLFVGALGSYLFARELRLGFWPAVLAGLLFGFSAFSILWLSFPLLGAVAMLPWALWLVERLAARRRRADGLLLTLVLVVVLLSGHPGTQVHVYAIVLGYAVLRALLVRLDWRTRGRIIGETVAAELLAAAIAAAVLLPVALTIRNSVGVEARSGGVLTLPLAAARSLVFPDWWGRPSDVYFAHSYNYNEGTIYAGTIALLLAALSLTTTRDWRAKLPLVVLGALGFEAAFGLQPTATMLAHTPLLESDRNARLSVLVQLACAVLAGFGLRDVLERAVNGPRIVVIAGGAAAVALVGLVASGASFHELRVAGNHFRTGRDYAIAHVVELVSIGWWVLLSAGLIVVLLLSLRRRIPPVAAALAIVALATVDVAHFARGYNPLAPEGRGFPAEPSAVKFLQRHAGTARVTGIGVTLPPDTSMVYRLRDVRGNDPPRPDRRFMDVFRLINPAQPEGDWLAINDLTPRGRRILNLFGVRYIVYPPGGAAPALRDLVAVYDQPDARIYRNGDALPRALVPSTLTTAPSEGEVLKRIAAPGFDPFHEAVVEQPAQAGSGDVRILRDDADTVVLRARMRRGGLVVLTDIYDAGWQATVDGHHADSVRVNDVFRGVAVGRGEHLVRWAYRPPGLTAGIAVTSVGLVMALAWLAAIVWRRRRSPVGAR